MKSRSFSFLSNLVPCAAALLAVLPFNLTAQAPDSFSFGAPQQASASIWKMVPTPNPTPDNGLLAISADSENDIWAVGGLVSLHFDGSSWSALPVAEVNSSSQARLRGVAALSPADVWAVGSRFIGSGLNTSSVIEHFDGHHWAIVPSPHFQSGDLLNGVQAISPNDIYAVGSSMSNGFEGDALIEHWDGTKWTVIPTPLLPTGQGVTLNHLAIISPSDIWAVGSSGIGTSSAFATHFDGHQWIQVPVPTPETFASAQLLGVTAISTNDVWAVGTLRGSGTVQRTLTEHWDGTVWTEVASPNSQPNQNALVGVSAISSDDVWACGFAGADAFKVLIEHWDGTRWTISPAPLPALPAAEALVAFPSGNIFVAGEVLSSPAGGLASLILHTSKGL